MSTSKRNGNIELLRFIFAVNILLLHLFEKANVENVIFRFQSGYLGVEFFFIITGVFLGKDIQKQKDITCKEELSYTFAKSRHYIISKIKSIYPFFILSCIIGFFVQYIYFKDIFSELLSLSDLLFLQNFGFPTSSCTGTVWFLSAMFIALFFLYPIIRKKYDIYVKYFAPFIVLFVTGYLEKSYGNMDQCISRKIIDTGVIRAVSDISFGLIINELASRIENFKLSKKARIALTCCEFLGYIIIFSYMSYSGKDQLDCFIFLLLGLCITLTICKQSFFYGKFDCKFVCSLGKISMPLFMNHYYWVVHFNSFLISNNYLPSKYSIPLTICISFITSIIVLFAGNALKKYFQNLKLQESLK